MSGGWFACSSGVKSRACSPPKPVLPPLTQLRAAAASAVVLAADSAGCARWQYAHLSQCCSHHDFDKHAGPPELRRQARAHRRITRINPLVPNCIVILKLAHVGKPHLRTKQPRSVRPRLLKKFVDALQYLSGLRFDAAIDRIRRYAGQVDDVAVLHCLTDNRLTSIFVC